MYRRLRFNCGQLDVVFEAPWVCRTMDCAVTLQRARCLNGEQCYLDTQAQR
jgi:hypothetical protein